MQNIYLFKTNIHLQTQEKVFAANTQRTKKITS